MVSRDEVIGCLELTEERRLRRFSAEELALADTLAALSAAAIGNARLQRRATTATAGSPRCCRPAALVSSTLVVEDVLARVGKDESRDPAGRRLLHLRVLARRGRDRLAGDVRTRARAPGPGARYRVRARRFSGGPGDALDGASSSRRTSPTATCPLRPRSMASGARRPCSPCRSSWRTGRRPP